MTTKGGKGVEKRLRFLFLYSVKLGSYNFSGDGSLFSSLVVNLRIF